MHQLFIFSPSFLENTLINLSQTAIYIGESEYLIAHEDSHLIYKHIKLSNPT